MRTKIFRVITAALMLALLIASASSALSLKPHTKYTLYIGLNDGKTGRPTYDQSDARRIFVNIAGKYVDGYTIYDAEGFWHEGENTFSERTLVCVIIDASEEAVRKIMDEALKLFRQNTILVERSKTESEFYGGK
ncbi:MAG: DUF3574 domain-containing protein [Synergistaceae bacterium]|nr:DUF3574 domain-containing protein [Synergistaceae bacterium]MBQ3346574.1 DUF3574 domain-containing protein [Synergistaceae bacterium]MBQ3398881.1 DUF3574 domain-containing protein [Synergistaceae bacterium]MBQ3758073.1 DUF3574 domain-containing protein [Synergistaceae bacterium]MBQ4401814.1 DUF3574 domain-containing protein [Synergistaceae bacterium]